MAVHVEVQVTKMSSKGQVVIPEQIRESLGLTAGSVFAVYGRKDADSILLKRLVMPEPAKAFEEMAKWGTAHAKKEGLDASPQEIVRKEHQVK
ncbi:MAG: AbrB/MazE/SpoVT family DNA-binding domain-containing protein [Candidatus Micrarchaeota archaeon]